MSASSLEVRIIVDNRPGDGLIAEHGFAALVRARGRTILLDTGQGEALARNAAALGIELETVGTLVLSHGHYDHTGGIPSVAARRGGFALYFHAGVLLPRYSVDHGEAREIGIPAASTRALEQLDARCFHPVSRSETIARGIGVAASIERASSFEDTGGPFFLDAAGRAPDPIEDDLALWIHTEGGLVVLVGCCHAGIANTLERVRRDARERRIRAVIGGLHLLHAGRMRIESTVAALESEPPQLLVPCHCTGERAVEALRGAFGSRVEVGYSGMELSF